MKRGRDFTATERSLYIIGVLAGKTLEEVNEVLQKQNKRLGVEDRLHPQSSYDMLRNKYAPSFRKDAADHASYEMLWEHVVNPKCLSEL